MPFLTPSHYALIVNNLNEFITTLKNSGYNISTTHYVSAHHLLNALAAQQQLPSDDKQLSQLLMPLLCCCEKEQLDFPRRFSFWLESLNLNDLNDIADNELKVIEVEKTKSIKNTQDNKHIGKTNKKNTILHITVVFLFGFFIFYFYEDIQQQIYEQFFNKQFSKLTETTVIKKNKKSINPVLNFPKNTQPNTLKLVKPIEVIEKNNHQNILKPVEVIENPISVSQISKSESNSKFYQNHNFLIPAFTVILLLLWLSKIYLQTHRFLTRHSVLSPPKLKEFFLNKPRPLFALLDFTFTAQQLHKHRHISSNYLDPQLTIKQTLAKSGIFTPCYQTLRAVPEYLVLIDRSSFKYQLAASVSDFIQQLLTIGLFIECFYFDEDPRRCYRQGETRPQALDGLLANYPSHRLLVFSDSGHFIDPSTGLLNQWASEFAHSQQPVLFTFTGLQAFGVREAMLHEAGFVVLPWDDEGFETLLQHFDEEREAIDFLGTEEHALGSAGFPVLVRRRAQRFLERHRPNEELTTRLLQELKSYLGADGFFWLAACAVYPQLESQLTLHLGYALLGEENFAQSLFIRLLRLPWFRHGFMPDWLRWLLLANLTVAQDKQIRAVIYQLLLNASAEQEGKSFKLEVAKEGEVLHWAKRIVKVWTRRAAKEHELKDFVFQSFLQGKLSVKAPDKFFLKAIYFFYNTDSLNEIAFRLVIIIMKVFFFPLLAIWRLDDGLMKAGVIANSIEPTIIKIVFWFPSKVIKIVFWFPSKVTKIVFLLLTQFFKVLIPIVIWISKVSLVLLFLFILVVVFVAIFK